MVERIGWLFLSMLLCVAAFTPGAASTSRKALPKPLASPYVITLTNITADSAAHILRSLYPQARFTVDRAANTLLVSAPADDAAAIRQIAAGIDAKNPLTPQVQVFAVHRIRADNVASRLHALFPMARFSTVNAHTLLVKASNPYMQQIQTLISGIDAPPPTPTPAPAITPPATEAVRIFSAAPRNVAREVAGAVRGLRVSVAGQSLVLAGSSDLVQRGKDLIAVLDAPPVNTRYTAVYRIRTLDAKSVADLLTRSFPDAKITVDEEINSISAYGTASEQRRISDGIAQLDNAQTSQAALGSVVASGPTQTGPAQIYTLKYALPGQNGAPSTSGADLATMVTQTLASQAPDLHVNATPGNTQLILTGNPYSVKLARDLLAQIDVPQRLVVLDTEILEMDENTAKNLGIQLQNAAGGPFGIGTVFTEVQPTADPNTGIAPPIKRLLPLTRTPIGFAAILNLAVQHGTARVLADPRITTLSAHTATIRAGDNISIQLQAGGGAGTIATTQIQTFQTGVTLDITPIVNDNGLITVALHPVVNSLTGILNGIPQISTRDTQTTVALQENETLVIGGLIQDNTQRTESRIPVLGDLPLVGRLFRNETLNGNRNELIISVTPHVVIPGQPNVYPGPPLPAIPTPQLLPTLPPGTILPTGTASAIATPAVLITPPAIAIPRTLPTNALPPSMNLTATATPSSGAAPTISPSPPAPFTQANTFTFGSPPTNNYAASRDAVRIYYATLTPTVLAYGKPVSILAITTTNVTQLSLAYNGISISVPQAGPGQWQGSVPFTLVSNPVPSGTISLALVATKADGTQAMIPIPVTVLPQLGEGQISTALERTGRGMTCSICDHMSSVENAFSVAARRHTVWYRSAWHSSSVAASIMQPPAGP